MRAITLLGPFANASSGFLRMREISPLLKKITQIVISILLAMVVGRGLYQLSLMAFKPSQKYTSPTIVEPALEEPSLPKAPSVRDLLQTSQDEKRISVQACMHPSELEHSLPKEFLDASLPYVCFLKSTSMQRLSESFLMEDINSFYKAALEDANPLNRFVCFVLISNTISSSTTSSIIDPRWSSSVTLTLRERGGTENQESCRKFLKDLEQVWANLNV